MTQAARERIAAALVEGPRWMRSFQAVKPVVEAMIEDDLVGRVRPENGAQWNMIALTRFGERKYFPDRRVSALATSRAELTDELTALVSDGLSVREAAARMGIPLSHAQKLWNRLCHELGGQAA